MKFNCAFCKQENNDKGGPYYDWRDTKKWIVLCRNCGAKLIPSPSISYNEKLTRMLWQIFMVLAFILYTLSVLVFPESRLGQFRAHLSFLLGACCFTQILIFNFANNREIETVRAE